jgi:hypothetical protein
MSLFPLSPALTPCNPARHGEPAAARPRSSRPDVHPLAALLAMEGRPRRVAVWAPDGSLHRSLAVVLPQAECFGVGCPREAAGADAVVLAPTLARSYPVSATELLAIVAGLPAGGLLAVQHHALSLPSLAGSAWGAGSSVDPAFEGLLDDAMMPLHRTEGRRGLGLWREVLWVGRKGRWIR